jgi:type IV pilus assembly protein PilQ
LIQPGGDVLLDEIITAAEAKGTAKLISRPRVTTQNNIPANIQQGTQIPVQTNVNNTITTTFQSFALQLTVTPQITEAGTILLQVNITNSQPDFARAVNGIPSVANQSATTQVLIPDGGTAVIGGILVDTDSLNIRQVPGLGDLPIIGTLFKNTTTVKSTAELVFFITPRIKPLDSISVLAPGDASLTQPQQR